MKEWIYLELDEILMIHDDQILNFGGLPGIRDQALLNSAVMQADLVLYGKRMFTKIYEVAAIYAYHIVKNHAFVDGNKRTGIVVALTFLEINGYEITVSNKVLYDFVVGIASSKLSEDDVIIFFKRYVKKVAKIQSMA